MRSLSRCAQNLAETGVACFDTQALLGEQRRRADLLFWCEPLLLLRLRGHGRRESLGSPSCLFQSLQHCQIPLTCWQMSTPRSARCKSAFLAAVTSLRRKRVQCEGGKREATSSGVNMDSPEARSDSSR